MLRLNRLMLDILPRDIGETATVTPVAGSGTSLRPGAWGGVRPGGRSNTCMTGWSTQDLFMCNNEQCIWLPMCKMSKNSLFRKETTFGTMQWGEKKSKKKKCSCKRAPSHMEISVFIFKWPWNTNTKICQSSMCQIKSHPLFIHEIVHNNNYNNLTSLLKVIISSFLPMFDWTHCF